MIQTTYFKTKKVCKVKFSFNGALAEKVELFGLNNDWQTPVVMTRKKDGSFAAEVSLPNNSKQEFRYLINGTDWVNEPDTEQSWNEYGTTNSVINL
ncbi:isoamylase early set domain-containing protein [Mucilaginibacter sp.]|uniref:isoamylase early set domain-containing protein n=1 Tax=Mucilaginibacter sp. TaxID=1882438 RepID=UPI003B0041B8